MSVEHMNATREHVLKQIQECVCDISKSENIERSVFNYSLEYASAHNVHKQWGHPLFVHIYKQKAVLVIQHLHNDQNLFKKIQNGDIKCKDVACYIEQHLNISTNNENPQEEVSDGIFECKKCGSKKTTYYSLQTRSADEPMTNFITCVMCKNRWKM